MIRGIGETVGVVAGRGSLAPLLAERLAGSGIAVAVAALSGQVDPRLFDPRVAARAFFAGDIGRIAAFFLDHGARRAYFAGGVDRALLSGHFRPDGHALALLPLILRRGDDSILRRVAGRFERLGVEIGDPARHLPDLLAAEGPVAGPSPTPAILSDLAVARRAALATGRRDAGQGALAYRGRVAGVEAQSGTDALLAVAPGPGAVLAKMCKPGQDLRFDRPAIGPSTVLIARHVGLAAIGVEAGGCLVLEPARVRALCETHGISLVGIACPD